MLPDDVLSREVIVLCAIRRRLRRTATRVGCCQSWTKEGERDVGGRRSEGEITGGLRLDWGKRAGNRGVYIAFGEQGGFPLG